MVESLGKKLEAARVKKQMTIEDVARATKIRPAAVADLERDDYSNFPSLAYAKGFVILYAKYLGVDTGEINSVFGTPNEFGVSDYEYLAHTVENETAKPHRPEPERSRSGTKALFIIAIILLIVGAAFYYGAQFLLNVKRLEPNGQSASAASASPAPSLTANSSPSATPKSPPKIAPAVLATPRVAPAILVATPPPAAAPQISATPTPIPSPTATPAPSAVEVPTIEKAELVHPLAR